MGEPIAFPRDRLPALVIIEDEHVRSDRLLQVLESIFVDGEIDGDGDVYVSSGLDFPVWISVDTSRKYVNIFTCIGIRDVGVEAAAAAANDLNKRLFLVKFHTDAQALWGNAWISYDGGLSVRQFVRTLRRFATVFQQATGDEKVAHLFRTETES